MKVKFLICSGKHCRKLGSKDVACAVKKYCRAYGLDDAKVKKKDCLGYCGRGPMLKIVKNKEAVLGNIEPGDCKKIVRAVAGKKKRSLGRFLVGR